MHEKAAVALEEAREAYAVAQTELGNAEDDDARAKAQKVVDAKDAAITKADQAEEKAKVARDDAAAAAESASEAYASANAEAGKRPEPVYGEPLTAGAASEFLPEEVKRRADHHPHESNWQMTTPLVVLAVLSIFGGLLNLPFTSGLHFLEHWLEPSILFEHKFKASALTKWILAIVSIIAGGIGITAAVSLYLKKNGDPSKIEKPILLNGWGYDAAVSSFMGGPGARLFDAITWFDANVVDGLVNGTGSLVRTSGTTVRRLQSGLVRSYALGISIGSVALLAWFLVRVAS